MPVIQNLSNLEATLASLKAASVYPYVPSGKASRVFCVHSELLNAKLWSIASKYYGQLNLRPFRL